MSLTMFSLITEYDMDDIPFKHLLISMRDPSDTERTHQIATELIETSRKKLKIVEKHQEIADSKRVQLIMDLIFYMAIFIMMFLCFFSLIASMSANLLEQSKEIGIMRAVGITGSRIKFLYFYEAAILVVAACVLGVMIGYIVGTTISMQ